MEKIILIKYGELTTKKANRNYFINLLYENVKDSLKKYDVKISKNRVRMFIEVNDNHFNEVIEALSCVLTHDNVRMITFDFTSDFCSMMEAGIRRENRKDYVDMIAATLILQGYLDLRGNKQ